MELGTGNSINPLGINWDQLGTGELGNQSAGWGGNQGTNWQLGTGHVGTWAPNWELGELGTCVLHVCGTGELELGNWANSVNERERERTNSNVNELERTARNVVERHGT